MDMQMLANDVEVALDLLPPAMVHGILGAVFQDMPAIAEAVPKLFSLLAPHVSAGVLENQVGSLSLDDLAKTLVPVMQRYLIRTMPGVSGAHAG